MMSGADVLEVLAAFEFAGLVVWIDGGWGIDALLGAQTREHNDLDIAARSGDEPRLREVAAQIGFLEVSAEPHNPVLQDALGRTLDVHFVDLNVTRPGPSGWMVYGDISFDVGAFEGHGSIGGQPVACTTVVSQVRSHTGYALDDNDVRDMVALHRRFGMALPAEIRDHTAFAAIGE